jgi:ElaB/YqjD/DUF883 family membrane-anchored ribosome-binding protein
MGQGSDPLSRHAYDAEVSPVDADTAYAARADGDDDYQATTQQIEAEIEQTRMEMSQTINAIQERLSPQHLAEQAKDAVYDATIGTAKGVGYNMIETIKQNPLPAAIAALSIGWLFRKSANANNQNWSDQRSYRGYQPQRFQPYDQYGYDQYGYEARSRPAAYTYYGEDADAGLTDRVGQKAEDVKHRVQDVASNVKDQAQDMAGNVKDQAQHLTHEAREQVEYYGEQAREQVGEARDWLQHQMYENPIAIGAVALAIGTAVGLSLPATPVENRVLGEARDSLVEKVQETASETIDKVQSVAQQATSAASDAVKLEAREQGLSK